MHEAHAIAEQPPMESLRWRTLQRFGEFAIGRDDPALRREALRAGPPPRPWRGPAAEEAVSVYSLGVTRRSAGDLAGAEQLIATPPSRCARSRAGSGSMLSPLNISETRPGDAATSPALQVVFEETLAPFFELSLEGIVPYVLANQATIARLRGDHAAAHRLLDEARGLFERSGDRRGLAAVLVGRAYLELAAGSTALAQECLEQALEMRRALNDRRGAGMAMVGLGLVGIQGGELELGRAAAASSARAVPARRGQVGARQLAVAYGRARAGPRAPAGGKRGSRQGACRGGHDRTARMDRRDDRDAGTGGRRARRTGARRRPLRAGPRGLSGGRRPGRRRGRRATRANALKDGAKPAQSGTS